MKLKRFFGILLALAMLFTALPVLPLAAPGTQEVSQMLADYGAKYGSYSAAFPTDTAAEQVAAIDAIVAAYGQLPSDAAKDALGSTFFCNLHTLMYYYLRSKGITAAAAQSDFIFTNFATPKMEEAKALARLIYGGQAFTYTKPSDGTEGSISFATGTDFSNQDNRAAYEQFYAYLKAQEPLVLEYLALFNTSYLYYTAATNSFPLRAVVLHMNYLTATDTQGLTRQELFFKFLNEYTGMGAYTTAFRLVHDAKEALGAYDASGAALDWTGMTGLQSRYDALPRPATKLLEGMSSATGASAYFCCSMNGKNLAASHVAAVLQAGDSIRDLLSAMTGYDFDNPSNDTVLFVIDSVNKMSTNNKSYFRNEPFNALYDRVVASYQGEPRPPRDDSIPAQEDYTKSKVSYPNALSKFNTTFRFNALDPLVQIALEVLMGTADELYTDATVSTLAALNGVLYDMLDEGSDGKMGALKTLILDKKGATPDTATLAKHLTEARYAEAKAKLEGLKNFTEFIPEEYTWGVTPGDRESFVEAATAVLRPVTSLLYYFSYIPDEQDSYGNYVSDGTYETAVLPFLEALGCRGVVPADEFMKDVRSISETVPTGESFTKRPDAFGRALINPILNLLEDLLANPLPMALDLLPRLAYAEQAGDLDAFYTMVLDFGSLGGQTEFMPFQSLQALVDMLAPSLPINMPAIDWEYLAHLGTLTAQSSANGKTAYKNFVTADRADVYTYLINSVLNEEGNKELIGDLVIGAIGLNASAAQLLEMQATFKDGEILDGMKLFFSIVKGLFQDPPVQPCCEDKEACGCTCGDEIKEDCPCACEGCAPAPGGEEEPGISLSTGEIFRLVFRFIGAYFRNVGQFTIKLFTGKIALK